MQRVVQNHKMSEGAIIVQSYEVAQAMTKEPGDDGGLGEGDD